MRALNKYLGHVLAAVIGFARVHGLLFLGACAALALSRACQVLAFFLPLKIFILIHSDEIPSYFDIFPAQMGIREVVLVLSGLVPVVYALFIVLGIIYRWLIDLHLKRFGKTQLQVGGKITPEGKMKRLHNHVSKAFSEVGLIVVSTLVALVMDAAIAVAWTCLLYANLWLFHRLAFQVEDHHRLTFLRLHRRQFIEYISSANFLVVFAVLAIQLVFFDLGMYSAIFLLLVSRMVFQALNRFSVESLYILKCLP